MGGRLHLVSILSLLGLTLFGCGGDDGTGPTSGLQPNLASVSPDSGNVGTQVEISGSDFESGATVEFDDLGADSVLFVDATTLLAFAPDGLVRDSVYDLVVRNPGGKSDELADAYRAVAPALQVVNGVSKPSGNPGSTVILDGKSFGDLVAKGSIFFSDGTGAPVEAAVSLPENWTNEFLVTQVPNDAETGPVWVETPTGATDSIEFTVTESANFSPSSIQWTESTALPEPGQGHGAVFLAIEGGAGPGQLVYVTGGADGSLAPRTSVVRSPIDASGELTGWTAETPLPAARAFHSTTVASPFNALIDTAVAGHLYVVGGIDAGGSPTSTVFTAPVDRDRSVGSWTETTALPEPLHSAGITIFRSWLYLAGGATVGDEPVANVYRAPIREDGSLGPWETQASLPYARAHARLAQFGGVLYMLGGDTAAVAPGSSTLTNTRVAEIHYHPLDLRTGELRNASWTLNPNELIKQVAKHSAVVAGGWILASGGLYNGASNSSTEHQFASINPDGTIDSFGGATGSETIAGSGGAGGVPFFNHAAISYVDASGVAHVVILGGNNVDDETTPVAEIYFY